MYYIKNKNTSYETSKMETIHKFDTETYQHHISTKKGNYLLTLQAPP